MEIRITCAACEGTGKVPSQEDCPRCQGRGSLGARFCPDCSGSGRRAFTLPEKLLGLDRKTCGACQGQGCLRL